MQKRILVVENHPDLRAEILAVLGREQIDCEGVSTGDAAMLKLRDHDYRYVILDVDGATAGKPVFESLRDNGTLGKLVLLTDSDETGEMPRSASECKVLLKPFDGRQLLARLRR